jgi:hypothetical protein
MTIYNAEIGHKMGGHKNRAGMEQMEDKFIYPGIRKDIFRKSCKDTTSHRSFSIEGITL